MLDPAFSFLLNQDNPMMCYVAADDLDEATYIIEKISYLHEKKNIPLEDMCVLYRFSEQCDTLTHLLDKGNIPYVEDINSLTLDSPSILLILSLIHLFLDPEDEHHLSRVISSRLFGLSLANYHALVLYARQMNTSLYSLYIAHELPIMQTGCDVLIDLFDKLTRLRETQKSQGAVSELVKTVLNEFAIVSQLEKKGSIETLEEIENITEFSTYLSQTQLGLATFKVSGFRTVLNNGSQEKGANTVSLVPIENCHQIKYKVVFVLGVEEGILPHYKAQFDETLLSYEKTYFANALRAGTLYRFVTNAYSRVVNNEQWHNDISRFIYMVPKNKIACFVSQQVYDNHTEILDKLKEHKLTFLPRASSFKSVASELNKYVIGDKVGHQEWGEGVVKDIQTKETHSVLRVQFKDQVRDLTSKYAVLDVL